MFRKNKDFGVALQPVVMALTLNRQKQRERIIIGPEWEVQKYMEGKMVKTKLLDMERSLGRLIFDCNVVTSFDSATNSICLS